MTRNNTRESVYHQLTKEVEHIMAGETNLIANLANVSALIKTHFNFFWVGFYLVESEDELILGPFQGPVACTRIKKGKGVCGTSWQQQKTLIVPDVHKFEGHITCNETSKSEIVIPMIQNDECIGVLDIDSDTYSTFDEEDRHYLEKILALIPKS